MIDLRPAEAADAPEVARVWYDGWRTAHLGNVPDALLAVRPRSSFDDRAAQRIPDTIVASLGGEIAGFVMVSGDEVDQVYVDATHRGTGIAATLLTAAESRIRAAGHPSAWLAVVPGNARARAFYTRQGWIDEGTFVHQAPGPDGPVPVPCHRYVKPLGA
ncbi:GNAT family N-acetyltransferase [Nocardia mexicana]|uniref:Ribosomal protein S18 acetylase RimI-like enzyme n=1 Tax=Nocardia mexicana TaxID=279262 RepID=A0A370GGJ2_9NOCA|nr:GNAT family N-acetyltransferase [Nocardia mexicana]RDI42781.1 ribosomal protein S18 acetylase RimI-like enzyme [Nocardia mexicana]